MDGLNMIREFEGLRLRAYQDSVGVWTIGYGHTKNVQPHMRISIEQAEDFLEDDVRPIEQKLNRLGINLRQGQFDALVSFIFNLGEGAFNRSTLKKKILASATDREITAEFKRWDKVKINGKYQSLEGLTRRRAAEAASWVL